uniref:NADH-ubiquinone oxidoreductase chain 1 n=1 Tax=Allothyrus sp. LamingtonNP-QMS95173 TaxID=1442165 RepID=W0FI76_9ACAR|nr:NADH dehydrogenase subunit 1 [Allothyrus sp. LamingtonNP-QMS95173]
MLYLSFIMILVCVLVSVAFYTLLERKVLGYIQLRKGPNKVGIIGILQPFSDAVKLFMKEQNFLFIYNMLIYLMVPVLALFLMLLFWLIFPWSFFQMEMDYGLVMMLCISSLGVYVILGGGWASNSKYSLLGAYRGVAQVISYEVSMSMILIGIVMFISSYNLNLIINFQKSLWMLFGFIFSFSIWIVTGLAETNRTPFDFAEGESELVSGFNVEYSGGGFAMLFMAEYGNMIFMSMVTAIMFFGGKGFFMMKIMLIMFLFLWVRGTFARYRYDNLMMLAWKIILPYSIFVLFFMVLFKMYLLM